MANQEADNEDTTDWSEGIYTIPWYMYIYGKNSYILLLAL